MAIGDYPNGMRLLTLSEVEAKVGLKSSQIYRLIERGLFPAPVPLTQGARRWLVHESDECLRGRVALSLKISGERTVERTPRDERRRADARPSVRPLMR